MGVSNIHSRFQDRDECAYIQVVQVHAHGTSTGTSLKCACLRKWKIEFTFYLSAPHTKWSLQAIPTFRF